MAPIRNCTCGMPLCVCPPPKEDVEVHVKETQREVNHEQKVKPVHHETNSRPTYFSSMNSNKIDLKGDLNEQAREAIKSNSLDNLQLLVKNGVNVNYVDRQGQSLLHLAAIMGRNDMALWLVSSGANINAKNHQGESIMDVAPVALASKIKAMSK